jgi:hypothetical protein
MNITKSTQITHDTVALPWVQFVEVCLASAELGSSRMWSPSSYMSIAAGRQGWSSSCSDMRSADYSASK